MLHLLLLRVAYRIYSKSSDGKSQYIYFSTIMDRLYWSISILCSFILPLCFTPLHLFHIYSVVRFCIKKQHIVKKLTFLACDPLQKENCVQLRPLVTFQMSMSCQHFNLRHISSLNISYFYYLRCKEEKLSNISQKSTNKTKVRKMTKFCCTHLYFFLLSYSINRLTTPLSSFLGRFEEGLTSGWEPLDYQTVE